MKVRTHPLRTGRREAALERRQRDLVAYEAALDANDPIENLHNSHFGFDHVQLIESASDLANATSKVERICIVIRRKIQAAQTDIDNLSHRGHQS